jgi:putative acetyltransferase
MPAARFRATAPYQPKYATPIRFAAGDRLKLGKADPQWQEFTWARAADGREGWVHRSKYRIERDELAVALADYDARELAVSGGEVLEGGERLGGWTWCRKRSGASGWLPDDVLEPMTGVRAWRIRPIAPADDPAMARIIREVMPEFGAVGEGFAINDPEVDWMSRAYAAPRCAFFVVELDGEVAGGGGIAPLLGGADDTCELRKMYFLPALRGHGAGAELMARCLAAARAAGFRRCYLETLCGMDAARRLYERSGFRLIDAPMGATGHGGCNTFYLLDL